MFIAASPANGQEHPGLVAYGTGTIRSHTVTEHPGEVTPDKFAQLDQRLQAVEEEVAQLCTLHEQTLQLVTQLYDVMTAQKAKDIETVKEVLRKAQQYVKPIHERTHTQEPEPSSCPCTSSVPSP